MPTSFDSEGPADRDVVVAGRGADFVGITRGEDVVRSGVGDDVVKLADDRAVDTVDCGLGDDRVVYFSPAVDPLDVLVGCERVRLAG